MAQPQDGNKPQKQLIIASGDCSDADGFLTIPLYKASGADVLYFVNFSSIFNDEGCKFDYKNPHDPERKAIRAAEYPVMSSAEFAIPGFVHRGNWKEFYSNKFRDFSKYALINPNFKDFLLDNGSIHPDWFLDTFEPVYKNGQKPYGERSTAVNNAGRIPRTTDDQYKTPNATLLKQEILHTFYELMYRMINKLWSETLPKQTNKIYIVGYEGQTLGNSWFPRNPSVKKYFKYHLNAVNPFALYLLGDDVDTYAEIFQGKPEEFRAARNVDISMFSVNNINSFSRNKPSVHVFEGLPEDTKQYDKVYIDFNGSMAFYNVHKDWIVDNFMGKSTNGKNQNGKVKGVYMMGGVEAQEPPKTLSMFSIVRYSCATINQVFHPDNTVQFLKDMNDAGVPIHVATNNYVNRHDVWDLNGKNGEIEPENAIMELYKRHKSWIPDSPTLHKVLFAYYGEEGRLVRIYDVPVAMKLVHDIIHRTTSPQPTSKLYVAARGATLVDINASSEAKNVSLSLSASQSGITAKLSPSIWKTIVNKYGNQLAAKYLPPFGNFIHEINYLRSIEPQIVLDCYVFDDIHDTITNYFLNSTTILNNVSVSTKIDNINLNISSVTPPQGQVGPQEQVKPPRQVRPQDQSELAVTYDFTGKNIIVCSDWEGGVPVTASKRLKDYLLYDNHALTLKNESTALIFAGDLIDNSTHSIRLMMSLLEITENILVVGGNRDFNKIRLADEHFMLYDDNPCITSKAFTGKTLDQAIDIIKDNITNFTFKFSSADIINQGYKVKPWHINNYALFERTLQDRVGRVYLDMYGIGTVNEGAVSFIFKELVELGLVENSSDSLYKTIAVLLFNMLASRNWTDDVQIQFIGTNGIDYTERFNGLYVKYMKKCEMAAIFKQGDNYGFVSHGGFSQFSDYMTDKLGLSYELTKLRESLLPEAIPVTFQQGNITDILKAYNGLKDSAIANLTGVDLVRKNSGVQYMIHMTAGTKYYVEEGSTAVYHHSLSPILGYQAPRKGKQIKLKGGKRPYSISGAVSYTGLNMQDGIPFKWVIYGHQPRGIIPAASKKDNTYHICLDVSKVEGQTNNTSYAAMVIPATGDVKVFGKIDTSKLDSSTTNIIHDPSISLPKTISFDCTIDELVTMQNTREYIIKYSSLSVAGLGSCVITEGNVYSSYNGTLLTDENSTSRTSESYAIFYISNFMGTSPGPIMSNKIFITSSEKLHNKDLIDFSSFIKSGGAKKRLSKMTLKELYKHAKMLGIKGRSKMDQKELIESIKKVSKRKKTAGVSKTKKGAVVVE